MQQTELRESGTASELNGALVALTRIPQGVLRRAELAMTRGSLHPLQTLLAEAGAREHFKFKLALRRAKQVGPGSSTTRTRMQLWILSERGELTMIVDVSTTAPGSREAAASLALTYHFRIDGIERAALRRLVAVNRAGT